MLFPIPWSGVAVCLTLAVALGGIIGWDREQDHQLASFGTNMLVSLGLALVVLGTLQSGMKVEVFSWITRMIGQLSSLLFYKKKLNVA